MPETVKLTAAAAKKADADAGGSTMLTKAEIEAIATKLNHAINLPILDEKREQVIFYKIVKKVDEFLYSVLPNEVYELIRVVSDGISPNDAVIIENNLAELATQYIDIPIVPKAMEETIYRVVIGTIVRAMLKGKSLKKS